MGYRLVATISLDITRPFYNLLMKVNFHALEIEININFTVIQNHVTHKKNAGDDESSLALN